MEINPRIFRGYDIRGVAGKDMDESTMELIGQAHGTYLLSLDVKKAVVGSDNRLTGEAFRQAIVRGLLKSGVDVIDLGMSLTAIVYWAQYHFESKGCVMVTASHNPAEYNGVKMGRDYSDTLTPVQEIKRMVLEKDFKKGEGKLIKPESNLVAEYNKDLICRIGKLKNFKVVIDASNGTAGKFMPELLREAGCEVIEQNCELDGSFPNGTPDPTEEFVAKRLAERAVKEKADLGFSYDADGDRIGIVDDKGTIIWNDVLVAILASSVLSKNPGANIVYNTLCSRVVEDVVRKEGGKPIMWITGHAFIKEKAKEVKAKFAGELSGHFFFLDNFYGHDDAGFASLRVLEYLTQEGKPLSEILADFPKYFSSPEIKITCPDEVKLEVLKKMTAKFKNDFGKDSVTDIDGVRVDFNDGMMIIRASQNGPYIVMKFEAKDEKTYDERRAYIKATLDEHPEIDWSYGSNLERLKVSNF